MKKKIFVTQPYLPDLEEYTPYLEQIWSNKQLTNKGTFHTKLENKLCEYLGVKFISLFSSGTTALLVAIKALKLTGEIITTPYSFVATAHSIKWNNITPVFIDIDSYTCNLNPSKIEEAITEKTSGILPVHIYGTPCKIDEIEKIAIRNKLNIIYDAAHAFGVKQNNKSIVNHGDLSVLSFHATKVFTTFEGGAIVSHSKKMKKKIDDLKNFGFQDEVTVGSMGINGKMNEVQAAMGLLQLKYIDLAIQKRKRIATIYRKELKSVKGICFIDDIEGVKHNYAYFPIFINKGEYGCSRDTIYQKLKDHNIYGRRYFYPLISQFTDYKYLPSASPRNLPLSEKISSDVICLPIYPDLDHRDVKRIIEILKDL